MGRKGGCVCAEYLARGMLEPVPRIERGSNSLGNIPKPSLIACNLTFLFLFSKYAPTEHRVNALQKLNSFNPHENSTKKILLSPLVSI